LGFVKQIREGITAPLNFLSHFRGGIVRVTFGIVGVDCRNPDPFRGIFTTDPRKLPGDVPDVGAVIADKHYQQSLLSLYFVKRHRSAGSRIVQRKIRSRSSERYHRRNSSHANSEERFRLVPLPFSPPSVPQITSPQST